MRCTRTWTAGHSPVPHRPREQVGVDRAEQHQVEGDEHGHGGQAGHGVQQRVHEVLGVWVKGRSCISSTLVDM